MRVEPWYGLPVEEPGDQEGWSIVSGQPGDLLAEATAAELDRIETDIAAFDEQVSTLPRSVRAGRVTFENASSIGVFSGFYNEPFIQYEQAVVFEAPFVTAPVVVLTASRAFEPGEAPIEVTVTNVSESGFTALIGTTDGDPTRRWVTWIAMEPTQ